MRLKIQHRTSYAYAEPARRAVQTLRLTPRGNDGQFVVDWRIDIDRDCRLYREKDAFGNIVHNFTVEGPLEELNIAAEGTVETNDTSGVIAGELENFPPGIYFRQTPLTTPDKALKAFAREHAEGPGGQVDRMHRIMDTIRERMRFEIDQTDTGTTASDALKLGHGVCQDFAHIMISVARLLRLPARYVGGYMFHGDGTDTHAAGHAWAEVLIDDLGWVGFDPANGISPTEAYVRVATGLDYLGAAPVRGTRYGGEAEKMDVTIAVQKAER